MLISQVITCPCMYLSLYNRFIFQNYSLQNQDYASIQFGAISFFPSTPPLPAKKGASPLKSPTNGMNSHQWSPLNTLSPNR